MSEETKQRIIEAGADLIHRQGFNNTGLKDILKAADVPKGSFYFYFDNKEAFGIEVLEYYSQRFRLIAEDILKDDSRPALDRLKDFFEAFLKYFESHGYSRGCPVGNLAQEMSDLSGPFRARLEKSLDGMSNAFVYILTEAQNNGEVPADMDIRETAIFMVEASHGATIRMKATKSPEPLHIFHKFVFNKILK
ncbi:TetR family transcriptional regulator C-terminal domain-containing protein [uncultured Pseudodesulfovibrio sp.]|uniref:TetR/AcrR family transcriptional regulator n=1 Tax=uncultured Pseudodesulfovibrio sp. TaxID=2035858 RepID=UPI0029C9239F|nr:TetR family transcriptional regulator C-terminal domain-containing protein [uncultured Pseudodesulfovibrio sp.]